MIRLFAQPLGLHITEIGNEQAKFPFFVEYLKRQILNDERFGRTKSARIKTPDEINCLKMIASISSSGFQRALEVLRPGVLQSTVAKDVKRAVEDAGSEFGASKVMAGPLAFERGISSSDRRFSWPGRSPHASRNCLSDTR